MIDAMRRALTRVGVLTAHPAAFGVLLLYASLWFASDRESLNWHAIATLVPSIEIRKPCKRNLTNCCALMALPGS